MRRELLCIGFRDEPLLVDDEALVDAFADEATFIIGGDLEDKSPSVNLHELAFAPDFHSNGCRFRVGDVHVCPHGVLTGFEVGENTFQAGLLNETNHRDGRKDWNVPAAEALGAVIPCGDGLQTVLYASLNHKGQRISVSSPVTESTMKPRTVTSFGTRGWFTMADTVLRTEASVS